MLNPMYDIINESVNLTESGFASQLRNLRKLSGSYYKVGADSLRAAANSLDHYGKVYGTAVKSLEKEIPGIKNLWNIVKDRAARIQANVNAAAAEARSGIANDLSQVNRSKEALRKNFARYVNEI